MPITYVVDTQNNIIRTRCSGAVVLKDVIEHFRILEADPERKPAMDVILDVTDQSFVSKAPFVDFAFEVSRYLRDLRDRMSFGTCAVIAPTDLAYGAARVFEAVAGEWFRDIQVFRKASDAERWLKESDRRLSTEQSQSRAACTECPSQGQL